MPHNIAQEFFVPGDHALLAPPLPHGEFSVALHWSRHVEADAAHRWMRQLLVGLFAGSGGDVVADVA